MITSRFPRLLNSWRELRVIRSAPCSTSVKEILKNAVEDITLEEGEFDGMSPEELAEKCNKSRLSPQHRNMLFDKVPYSQPMNWVHETVRYHRKLYGKLGASSGVDPAVCWPTPDEIQEVVEFEEVAYPFTIQQMIQANQAEAEAAALETKLRQETIVKNIAKLETWKAELKNKLAKKEAEASAAKAKKERMVEEVRRHFGFKIDPKDERFKAMLEQKEKEEKKLAKEARKKLKEAKLIAKLQGKTLEEISSPPETSVGSKT